MLLTNLGKRPNGFKYSIFLVLQNIMTFKPK